MRARADARKSGWAAAMAGALALAVPACGGGDNSEAGPTATVPPGAAVTTTTNPYAIPEVIDAAYVNRVLEGLDAAVGDIVRLVIRTRDVPPEVIDRLKAVYLNREDMNLFLSGIQRDLVLNFSGYKPEPGNKRSAVDALLSASHGCIFARVVRSYADVAEKPSAEPSIEWIALEPRDASYVQNHYNPTPWMIALEGLTSEGTEPPNPCETS